MIITLFSFHMRMRQIFSWFNGRIRWMHFSCFWYLIMKITLVEFKWLMSTVYAQLTMYFVIITSLPMKKRNRKMEVVKKDVCLCMHNRYTVDTQWLHIYATPLTILFLECKWIRYRQFIHIVSNLNLIFCFCVHRWWWRTSHTRHNRPHTCIF